ncbi:MAG: ATP-binding protein [Lachnospiraceae bacterium]|nr:ATP-binding protein [Ruminococcus sp.]MCM1277067.1 ATP-binding protein [Lachnospiraceae bacterium]
MGIYLNPDNMGFQESLNSEIYVDKTGLIELTNGIIFTRQKYVCISRPRRFGKSMAADMLAAYYCRGENSREMFSNLKISKEESFEKHLNKYNVIRLNMAEFSSFRDMNAKVCEIEKVILFDITEEFSDINFFDKTQLIRTLKDVYAKTKIPFIFIIDEWDCVFREQQNDTEAHRIYLDFLRNLLKDQTYVALAYMTGILPIKKYGVHSALNMFTEISMTNPEKYAEFTGFTESEVKELCERYNMPFDETRRWYNGYNLAGLSIYNPRSVVMSMLGGRFYNYWTSTESFEALTIYIKMNFDGLRADIIKLVSGECVRVDTTTFANDMVTFNSKDDVMTLLIHLGYLTYNIDSKTVSIPDYEIAEQFASTIRQLDWGEVAKSLKVSDELLKATLAGRSDKVAAFIQQAHMENTSILKYNDENSLACVISLAYYSAREKYEMWRELPTGEGFADLVFLPRKNVDLPALVVELKVNKSADTAIEQIKRRQYTEKIMGYSGDVLLVGISYDAKEKTHGCVIEKISK